MLLTEIVATAHHRPGDPRGEYEFVPDIDASNVESRLGVKNVKIHLTKEERDLYARYPQLPRPPEQFPVVYAYTLIRHDTEEGRMILDAIKKRPPLNPKDPTSFMSDENLEAFMAAAVHKLSRGAGGTNVGQTSGTWKQTKQALNWFSRILTNPDGNVVIVPLDSSSEVVGMMSRILAREAHAPVVDGTFIKALPRLSKFAKQSAKTGEYEPRTTTVLDYRAKHREYQAAIADCERQIDKINHTEYKTDKQIEKAFKEIEKLETKKQSIQEKLKNLKFQIKKVNRASTSGGQVYYNFQKAIPARARRLEDELVVLVDDNVDSGVSMADAVKSLYRAGIQPKYILGFCPHALESPKKTKEPA